MEGRREGGRSSVNTYTNSILSVAPSTHVMAVFCCAVAGITSLHTPSQCCQ